MDTQYIMGLDGKYYINTFGKRLPIVVTHGEGCILYDINGNPYIDFLAGIAVNSLGYNHPAIIKAVTGQAKKIIHTSNIVYNIPQAELAKLLVENSCGDRVFFANSGAEANEAAIKLARKYFSDQNMNKYEIITASNSFHGRTLATIAATGQSKYQDPFKPLPTGFKHVPYNDLEAVKMAITDKTCAVMIEPIQGEGGIIEGTFEYIRGLENLCKKHNILLIFDEVQTGIGRTGKLFAYEHFDVKPHIFTLAKGLGGGIPIGAVVVQDKIAKSFTPGDHGTTFGGNPLCCAASYAVLNTILQDGFLNDVSKKGIYFKNELIKLKKEHKAIKDVRGKGLMLGLELNNDISGRQMVEDVLKYGILINCTGHNTLRFVPPLIIDYKEIDVLVQVLDKVLPY
ncbi:MAG: aspartate aminotransferase family protein [Xylanivirga thermophila]|jgi:acetylornithine/N-succinyldiaminopimelate aminotransferase|uniref:aspartate aminotransferase family protein n=1 Tax=Xylanivirga thermophila TaxID=2496273 RepID=UPI00101DD8A5|nr:aspartate aminotransferase family protein [Xylanivirga thermophila]